MSLKESGERLLAEALADAMDRDLERVPSGKLLEEQHRFSRKFERKMRRLERNVDSEAKRAPVTGNAEKLANEQQKTARIRPLGASARRYGGLAAALVCIVGLAAVTGVMSRSLRMGGSKAFESIEEESGTDTAAPEFASDEAAEEFVTEDAADSSAAAEESVTEDALDGGAVMGDDLDSGAAAGTDDAIDKGSSQETGENPTSQEQFRDQEAQAPGWQEQLLLESARADELVSWHLRTIYEDGSIGLGSQVLDFAQSDQEAGRQMLRVSNVYEVYYEKDQDEWERVYHTERMTDQYGEGTDWDEWYELQDLNMTQAGTYRLVRQVNSCRQVLQLTLDEK